MVLHNKQKQKCLSLVLKQNHVLKNGAPLTNSENSTVFILLNSVGLTTESISKGLINFASAYFLGVGLLNTLRLISYI